MLILMLFVSVSSVVSQDLKLKSVLVLSRHNIRTPVTENLCKFSPKEWPKWDKGPRLLTAKGALMEGYMGTYFHQWLTKEKLLTETCPQGNSVYIYSNTKSRTIETAKAFAKSAFKNCNVAVNHLNSKKYDPIFEIVVRNKSTEFKKAVIKEMEAKLKAVDVKVAFTELARILNLKESCICKKKGFCDFNKENNTIIFEVCKEIGLKGPLWKGTSILDSFIMSYYEGWPEEKIAWGEINTPKKWELLTEIVRENQNVRINLTTAGKDLACPLLKYMSKIFLDDNSTRKFTLLVGHDFNLNTVERGLEFQPYVLRNQYESFPIGGKFVFQKWTNGVTDFLKLEYVYPSWTQLREGAVFSSENPPQRVVLELKGCKSDDKGFCPWKDFVRVLKDLF